jgi:hypothetical protein
MRSLLLRTAACTLVFMAVTVAASAEGFGYEGWGVRAGISETPDQFVIGAHVNLGEFAPGVRFQPSIELGFGDDVFTAAGNLAVFYFFPIQAAVTPYVGGQISAVHYNLDKNCDGFGGRFGSSCDSSETEIGPAAVGGIEMEMSGGSKFLAEVQVGFNDLPEVKLIAGWTF